MSDTLERKEEIIEQLETLISKVRKAQKEFAKYSHLEMSQFDLHLINVSCEVQIVNKSKEIINNTVELLKMQYSKY